MILENAFNLFNIIYTEINSTDNAVKKMQLKVLADILYNYLKNKDTSTKGILINRLQKVKDPVANNLINEIESTNIATIKAEDMTTIDSLYLLIKNDELLESPKIKAQRVVDTQPNIDAKDIPNILNEGLISNITLLMARYIYLFLNEQISYLKVQRKNNNDTLLNLGTELENIQSNKMEENEEEDSETKNLKDKYLDHLLKGGNIVELLIEKYLEKIVIIENLPNIKQDNQDEVFVIDINNRLQAYEELTDLIDDLGVNPLAALNSTIKAYEIRSGLHNDIKPVDNDDALATLKKRIVDCRLLVALDKLNEVEKSKEIEQRRLGLYQTLYLFRIIIKEITECSFNEEDLDAKLTDISSGMEELLSKFDDDGIAKRQCDSFIRFAEEQSFLTEKIKDSFISSLRDIRKEYENEKESDISNQKSESDNKPLLNYDNEKSSEIKRKLAFYSPKIPKKKSRNIVEKTDDHQRMEPKK